jgi:hypothetical protein
LSLVSLLAVLSGLSNASKTCMFFFACAMCLGLPEVGSGHLKVCSFLVPFGFLWVFPYCLPYSLFLSLGARWGASFRWKVYLSLYSDGLYFYRLLIYGGRCVAILLISLLLQNSGFFSFVPGFSASYLCFYYFFFARVRG